jgi:hypothetical protein
MSLHSSETAVTPQSDAGERLYVPDRLAGWGAGVYAKVFEEGARSTGSKASPLHDPAHYGLKPNEATTTLEKPVWAAGEDQSRRDLLPNLPSFIRRVCSSFAPGWGVLRTQLV